jgi:hypothetical protein
MCVSCKVLLLPAEVCEAQATSSATTTTTPKARPKQQVEDRYEGGGLLLQARQESAKLEETYPEYYEANIHRPVSSKDQRFLEELPTKEDNRLCRAVEWLFGSSLAWEV